MRELHLFAGVGGGVLAGMLLGHRCVGAVEIDPYCQKVLRARQADGILPPFPIHGDVKTFDGKPWRGKVDVVAGGFPCQDLSTAGKGAGLEGKRSGLWFEMLRVVSEVAPGYVFVENVRALVRRGLGTVLGGLADLGFDAEWQVLSAAACGAPHRRERLWILAAHPDRQRREGEDIHLRRRRQEQAEVGPVRVGADAVRDTDSIGLQGRVPQAVEGRAQVGERGVPYTNGARLEGWDGLELCQRAGELPARSCHPSATARIWRAVGRVRGVSDGDASRVDRLRALGNSQVPIVATTAWRLLMARLPSWAG